MHVGRGDEEEAAVRLEAHRAQRPLALGEARRHLLALRLAYRQSVVFRLSGPRLTKAELVFFSAPRFSARFWAHVEKQKNAKIKRAKELYKEGYKKTDILKIIIKEFKLERDLNSRSWPKWLTNI